MIEKVMLMVPRYTLYKDDVRRCVSPLGLAYLAAFLEKQGYSVKIVDIAAEGYYKTKEEGDHITYGLEDGEIKKIIQDFEPDFVGISCIFTTQSKNAKDILRLVKEVNKDIVTSMGGSHPTYALDDVLDCEYLDYAVMGEGELSTLGLLEALSKGKDASKVGGIAYKKGNEKIINNNLQYVERVDDLPFPARHLMNIELYFKINLPQNPYCLGKRVTQVITSRGCPGQCIFCTTTNFWGNRYRGRNSASVIAEIRTLKEKYNIDEVQFTDDNLTLNKKRAIEILDGIKEFDIMWSVPQGVAVWTLDDQMIEKMKESGCYQLTFAIESGNQEVLNKIVKKPLNLKKVKPLVKKAQALGIGVHAFCICGLPGETIDQMHQTYDFVKDCRFDSASFFAATPLVGSELLQICREKGYLRSDISCNDLLYKVGNISTPEFQAGQINELVRNFNKAYNSGDKRAGRFESHKY